MATIEKKIKVGDVGTVYRFTVRKEDGSILDISTAQEGVGGDLKIKVRKKDGTEIERDDCTFTTDGTDGQFQYKVTQTDVDDGDFHDVKGNTRVTGYVDVDGAVDWAGHTTTEVVRIYGIHEL